MAASVPPAMPRNDPAENTSASASFNAVLAATPIAIARAASSSERRARHAARHRHRQRVDVGQAQHGGGRQDTRRRPTSDSPDAPPSGRFETAQPCEARRRAGVDCAARRASDSTTDTRLNPSAATPAAIIAGPSEVRHEHRHERRVQRRRRDEHARKQHRVGGDAPNASSRSIAGCAAARARERERDVR